MKSGEQFELVDDVTNDDGDTLDIGSTVTFLDMFFGEAEVEDESGKIWWVNPEVLRAV